LHFLTNRGSESNCEKKSRTVTLRRTARDTKEKERKNKIRS
jgi:hypothetical protein